MLLATWISPQKCQANHHLPLSCRVLDQASIVLWNGKTEKTPASVSSSPVRLFKGRHGKEASVRQTGAMEFWNLEICWWFFLKQSRNHLRFRGWGEFFWLSDTPIPTWPALTLVNQDSVFLCASSPVDMSHMTLVLCFFISVHLLPSHRARTKSVAWWTLTDLWSIVKWVTTKKNPPCFS